MYAGITNLTSEKEIEDESDADDAKAEDKIF